VGHDEMSRQTNCLGPLAGSLFPKDDESRSRVHPII
jgi:hypothetical protein